MRYRVEKVPHGTGTDVFFALALKGVVTPTETELISAAVRRATQFVRTLFTPAQDSGFELLAYNPGPGNVSVSLVLRVRVSGLSETEAMEKARKTATGLSAVLTLGNRYHWVPAEEAGADVFPSFPEGFSLYTINRRSTLLERPTAEDTLPDMPVNAPEQRAKPRASTNRRAMRMVVHPFLPQADPLSRILRLLSAGGCPALVSIAITPVGLYDREEQLLAATEAGVAEDSLEDDLMETAIRRMSLKESAFLLRVSFLCAEQGALAAMLAQSVGASLSAPADPYLQAGGFEARRVEDLELPAALADLRRIGFPAKPPVPGEAGWDRLPTLVSALEAGMVFRFPAAPCPGVPQRRPMAALTCAPAATGTLVGMATGSGGEQVPVRITTADRTRSILLVGATGSGKTQFMLATALQDIAEGHGLCLLDPHGDLYGRVLANVPASRRKDVIAFDCTLPDPGFSFNLLAHSSEQERDRVVESFMEIFGQLFDLKIAGGPIFEMYFRSALTLVMCDPEATLADFMKFFQDRDYRRHCIGLCKDGFVSAAWERIVATAGGDLSLGNVAPYVVSKMSPFLFNKQTRGIVSCRETTLDFNAAVRERKIVLVNLGKGIIGNLAASFIGMLFIEKILRAAMNPGNTQQAGRNFYLYADEFQNLATAGAAEALAEGRKYQLGCLLALQFLGQLPGNVLKAALGNAANLLCMRVGPEDADLLAEYFKPAFSKADLLSLAVGSAAASTLIAGEKPPQPFLLSTTNGLALMPSVPVPAYENVVEGAKSRGCGKRPRKRPGTAAKPSRLPSVEGGVE